jgi:hypothetical protein
MSRLAELRKFATELSTPERAEFAAFLLGTLEQPHHWEDDAEVHRRSEELDSGAVKGLTRDEFTRACGHLDRSDGSHFSPASRSGCP